MTHLWSRRGATAAIVALGVSALVWPAAAEGILAKLRAEGVLRIGVADNLPWSKINPDGSITGIAPMQVKAVAAKLGIPKVEAITVTYGQLLPGLTAGRWDMVGAALSISPERCAQVLFTDPFYRANETDAVAYLPGTITDMPKTFTEIAQRFEKVGMSTGARTVTMQKIIQATGSKLEIVMFNDSRSMIEGLLAKRVQVATSDAKTMEVLKQRGGFEASPVDSGEPNRGSAGAFRKEDRDFRDAFVAAQRELKKSGEVKAILAEYKFEYDETFMNISGDDACKL